MKAPLVILKTLGNKFALFACISLMLFSCKSGDTLADKGIFQKRKYQKGYHVNVKSPFDSKTSSVQSEKTPKKSFTESLRAGLTTRAVDPTLGNQIAKEAPPETERTPAGSKKQKKSAPLNENYLEEATASLESMPAMESGQNHYFSEKSTLNQPQDYYSARKLSTVALLSFIFGVLSWFILGIPFGIAAVVLGIIGIVQVENNRDIYKGQGFAIAGLILGLIAIVILLAYLSTVA